MNKFLLSVHVLAAIVAIGPVAVAASMFPPSARAALANPGDAHATAVSRVLYRICGVYSAAGLIVVLFGFLTAQGLGILGEVWLMVAIALTALAAGVLAFAVLPAQRDLMDEITAASTGGPVDAQALGAGRITDATVPAEDAPTSEAAAVTSTAAVPSAGEVAGAVARSRRLAMSVGIFNLLWVAVTVLMIIRPGSTTNV
ncbi:protease [Candidatus Frankia nodulisporulans]|uniref:protease n=1 Tax=Candidatus Frankia nodulisporulans TaxID=2060052 RepID=UPI0013D17240|nr:protease [Candidatus Frankia nodulisporulans]